MWQRIVDWKNDILEHKWKILLAILFVIIAIIFDYIAGTYVTQKAAVNEVHDLVLDYVPVINLNIIFVWLWLAIIAVIIIYTFFFKPRKIHYYFGMISSFILVRSFFIILTHLKTPIEAIPIQSPWIIDKLFFSNDLFFSGHTGFPFLFFLLFRKENKRLAYFMLAASIIMGLTVLLMHQHYSIDVFAAFFITYGIYKIGDYVFNKKR